MKKQAGALLALFAILIFMSAALAADFPIRQGDRGENVTALKERMYELGYFSSRKFSPIYNETTAERVSRLQKQNGLEETGEVDEALWALIFSDECLAADDPEKPKEESVPDEASGSEEENPALPDGQPEETATDDQMGENPEPDESASPAPASSVTEYASLFPTLTEEGFLPPESEEFSYADTEKGLWLYASPDLRVEIVRKADTSKKTEPRRWYEAEIFVRDGAEDIFRTYYHEMNPRTKKLAETQVIARENHLVFAVNSDWYYYRVLRNAKKRVMSVGVVLRGGEVYYDDPATKPANNIPNRDYLAVFPDGGMEVFDFDGPSAEELKDMGALDVLCFGPALLREGELTEQAQRIGERGNNNPRTGIGMVEKGHYVAIMVEGRTKKSVGCKLTYLADLFARKGCQVAFNLDGGGTSSMIFMGVYLNENTYAAQNRLQNEVIGIGFSDQVN